MNTDLPKNLRSFPSLNQLEEYCRDAQGAVLIFRGTTKKCSTEVDGVNSKLYRWAVKSQGGDTTKFELFNENYQPPDMEMEIVKKASRLFPDITSNRTILTSLQHLGGRTNLIDFSRNLYVALFFASNGEFEEDGELLLIDTKEMQNIEEIDYYKLQELAVVEPDVTNLATQRVRVQHSVFVYAKGGYIEREKYNAIPVAKEFKKKLIEHLRQIHHIYTDSIYDDLMGFVENEQNYETALFLFYRGDAYRHKGEYDSVIENYSRAIALKPDFAEAYNNRGNIYGKKIEYDSAIEDYDKAISLKPDFVEAYSNRALVYFYKTKYESAITDCTKAISLKPDFADAYYNRGNTYEQKAEYDLAIEDFTKAIAFKPNYAEAYNNRGIAYRHMGEYVLAIEDYSRAIDLESDYAEAYNNRGIAYFYKTEYDLAIVDFARAIDLKPSYASPYNNRGNLFLIRQQWDVARSDLNMAQKEGLDIATDFKKDFGTLVAFEKKYEVKVPDDIAEMLGER